MENIIVELSKYIIIILMTLYTLFSFTVFRNNDKKRQNRIFHKQRFLICVIHGFSFLVLFLNTSSIKIIWFYLMQITFIVLVFVIYQKVYKKLSKLVLNHMVMLLVISFIMLTRLIYDTAMRHFLFASIAMAICLIVPFLIDKISYLDRFGWVYGGAGIGVLLMVSKFGVLKYGARNWISIKGHLLQPSEFIKIVFIFSIAALLSKKQTFLRVVAVSIMAAAHVILLVLQKDLGGALIFFVTYLFMLYIATAQPLYLFGGFIAGSGAAIVAYQLFDHVKTRVMAWKNPWADIETGGYQIAQSLFAIGTGGWFGMGLGKGLPMSIPVRESDFIFSAISEEMGGIFAVCIILVYLSCFIMFINIAMKMKKMFYKLIALGLSIQFIFQVFLNLGGVTKFIPSTGVTLPLISSGGSSLISVILIFGIIQGLYVLNQEEEKYHKKSMERTKIGQTNKRKKKKDCKEV